MATRIKTGVLQGIEGLAVSAEVDLSRGLPGFHLVGLPNTEVRESRDRVLAALRNSGVRIPPGKITVNLAPAGIRKEGAYCDLAIAVGVVAAAKGVGGAGLSARGGPDGRLEAVFLGELSLFGQLRALKGLLPILLSLTADYGQTVVVPRSQAAEAHLAPGFQVVAASSLAEVLAWVETGRIPTSRQAPSPAAGAKASLHEFAQAVAQVASLEGQPLVRKAAVMAAVGRHNFLMMGPPGTGKTRLARLLGRLQPDLTGGLALEVTRIQSAAGRTRPAGLIVRPPWRAPHHTTTRAGLVGGGPGLAPGEVTLAHGGILFLDELTEFAPGVLEILREPLEESHITMVRGGGRRTYPAGFQLIAAMNPCRCGFLGSGIRSCRCSPGDRARHRSRISGPLMDRFDVFVEVGQWAGDFLRRDSARPPQEGGSLRGAGWRQRPTVQDFRRARERLSRGRPTPSSEAVRVLDEVRVPLGISLRGVNRCLRVAGTLAALDETEEITPGQVREALEFRREILEPPD